MALTVVQRIASLDKVPAPEEEDPLLSYARRLLIAAIAICLVAAVAAPSAGAAAGKNSSSASSASAAKTSAAQSKKAKAKAAVTKKRLALRIRRNARRIRAARRAVRSLGTRLRAAITGGDKTIDDKINGIVGVVTPVLTQLGDGLIALRGGLETLAAATTAGFDEVSAGFDEVEIALTDIGDFLGAQEYGAAKGRIALPAAAGGTVSLTPALVSADIPDTGNPSTASGEIPIDLTALPGALDPATISIIAAIRSAEADGGSSGDPAGQVGVLALLKCGAAEDASCSDGTDTYEPGELMCTLTTPENTFDLPDGTTTDQNLTNVQEAVDILDTDAPEDGASGTYDATEGDSCTADGDAVYTLMLTAQFADIPTSLDPGPED